MCHRKDPPLISRGFINWKKAGKRFLEHETSDCHKDCKMLLDIGRQRSRRCRTNE